MWYRSSFWSLTRDTPHKFHGQLYNRSVFMDRFLAMIHSRSIITEVEKFYYLLGRLNASSTDLVKSITLLNDTYHLARKALVQRYDKPRQLAKSVIEKLLTALSYNQESLQALNGFVTVYDENVAILESLDIPDMS